MSVLYDSHMHTPLCKHATGDPETYAQEAEKRGLKGIIITCHNPTEDNAWSPGVRMRVDQFDEYVALVSRATTAWAGRIDVRLGLESDYAPGMESWLTSLHGRADLNYILGSVHCMTEEYKALYLNGNAHEFQQIYFEHLAMAAESGLFSALAHPDLIKNEFPGSWDLSPLMDDLRRALDRIAATGTAMELNTSGLLKPIREMSPGPVYLAEMQARRIPVVLGSDAHKPGRVAADFEQAMDALEAVGYSHISYFLNRQRQDINISEARASLIPA